MELGKVGMIVGMVLVVLGIFFIFNGGITGNVLLDGVFEDDCSQSSIEALWDSVYVGGHDGLEFFTDLSGEGESCVNFYARKGDSATGEVWYLAVEESYFLAYYIQGNQNSYDAFMAISDYTGASVPFVSTFLTQFVNIKVHELTNEAETLSHLKGIMKSEITSFDEEYSNGWGGLFEYNDDEDRFTVYTERNVIMWVSQAEGFSASLTGFSADTNVAANENVSSEGANREEAESSFNLILWIVVTLVVVIIIGLVLWFFVFRKKDSTIGEVTPVQPTSPVVPVTPAVITPTIEKKPLASIKPAAPQSPIIPANPVVKSTPSPVKATIQDSIN